MGTNYYFVPKGYEQINLINKSTEEALKNIQDLYVKSIRNVIRYAEDLHPIYKELLNYEYSLDEIYASLRWPVEIPEIHICKISAGWVPCFQTNKHFSTYQEFLAFYDLFKDIFTLEDEYHEVIDIEELKKDLFRHKEDALPQNDRMKYNSDYYVSYKRDSDGFDWTNVDFS